MAKCKYCRRKYTIESWYSRCENATSVCPECADKLAKMQGYWHGVKSFINKIRNGDSDAIEEESLPEYTTCENRKQKGLRKEDDGEFTVYGRWILSDVEEYDEDGDDYEYGCTITFKPKGTMEVHGDLTLRNMTIEIYGDTKRDSCAAIIVDGAACFRNCNFVGHGLRPAVICKGELCFEDCRISNMETKEQGVSIFEVVKDEDNGYCHTEIMCGSSFDDCRSSGSLIKTEDVVFRDDQGLDIRSCLCKGPFINTEEGFVRDLICAVSSLENVKKDLLL